MKITLLTAFAFSVLACSGPVGILGSTHTKHHSLVKKLTREASFFGLEDVEYYTYVTYKSDELRKSYVDEYADRFHLPPDKKEKMLADEMNEASQFDVFVVSHYATNRENSKISKEGGAWRLSLSTSEDKTSGHDPDSVTMIATGRDPVFTYFYPHTNKWASNYLVKFKKEDAAAPLYLRMAGVAGDLLFTWKK
jgi:hypothetical protein